MLNMSCGVYEIRNKINEHKYIGSSINMWNRWLHHRRSLELNKHHSRYFQRAWNKYGETTFEFNKLLVCDRINLRLYEQECMVLYKPIYNKNLTATGAGRVVLEETKDKLRRANIGKVYSDEYKHNMSISLKKRILSPAAVENMRVATIKSNRNRIWSEESKQKERIAHQGKVTWLGKHHTEETKQKLRIANWGKKRGEMSPKTKMKISMANKGKKQSPEHIEKLRLTRIGRVPWNKGMKNETTQ